MRALARSAWSTAVVGTTGRIEGRCWRPLGTYLMAPVHRACLAACGGGSALPGELLLVTFTRAPPACAPPFAGRWTRRSRGGRRRRSRSNRGGSNSSKGRGRGKGDPFCLFSSCTIQSLAPAAGPLLPGLALCPLSPRCPTPLPPAPSRKAPPAGPRMAACLPWAGVTPFSELWGVEGGEKQVQTSIAKIQLGAPPLQDRLAH